LRLLNKLYKLKKDFQRILKENSNILNIKVINLIFNKKKSINIKVINLINKNTFYIKEIIILKKLIKDFNYENKLNIKIY